MLQLTTKVLLDTDNPWLERINKFLKIVHMMDTKKFHENPKEIIKMILALRWQDQ